MSSTYKVKLKKSAVKFLRKQDPVRQRQIRNIINALSEDPYSIPHVKPLSGFGEHVYRIRFGDFRLIYQVIDDQLIIQVLKIGSRGDVYKK